MRTSLPLVSVVIPIFNHEKYVAHAIDSVLNQNYPSIELIVLDDGSTDGSLNVLRNHRGHFRRVTHSNCGQAATLNKGFQMARGEIMAYLSADDSLLQSSVATAVSALVAHRDAALVYCDFNLVDSDSRCIRRIRTPEFNYFDMVVKGVCAPGPGAFFRRSMYLAAGPWDTTLRQIPDYEFWLRLGLEGKFLRLPHVLAEFRVHEDSQSFRVGDENCADEPVRVLRSYFGSGRAPSEITKARGRALSNAHILSARLHIRSGRYRAGIAHIGIALRLYPSTLLSLRFPGILINAFVNRKLHRLRARVNKYCFKIPWKRVSRAE